VGLLVRRSEELVVAKWEKESRPGKLEPALIPIPSIVVAVKLYTNT